MARFGGLAALPTVSALICAENATQSSQMKTHDDVPRFLHPPSIGLITLVQASGSASRSQRQLLGGEGSSHAYTHRYCRNSPTPLCATIPPKATEFRPLPVTGFECGPGIVHFRPRPAAASAPSNVDRVKLRQGSSMYPAAYRETATDRLAIGLAPPC